MPRLARLTYQGGFYHLYNRGLNKQKIFHYHKDYEKLLGKLSSLLLEGDWTIYAYCLMPNHYHLLVEERKTPIAKLIGRLFTSYGVFFNKKYQSQGPLFSDRFKSKIIQKNSYFLEVSRYIHLNPVKAGLVNTPEDYPFSSLSEYVGKLHRNIIDLEKVTTLLGDHKHRVESYVKFVKDGMKLDLEKYNPFTNKNEVVGSRVFSSHRKIGH